MPADYRLRSCPLYNFFFLALELFYFERNLLHTSIIASYECFLLFYISFYKEVLDFGYSSAFLWGQSVVLFHYAFSFPPRTTLPTLRCHLGNTREKD
jgi:hypothetical protein